MSEAVEDMVAFTNLTDCVYNQILLDGRPEMQESRAILGQIERRRLYKCVGQTKLPSGVVLRKVDLYNPRHLL